MDRQKLDTILLLSRIAILETMALKHDVLVRALISGQPKPPQFAQTIQEAKEGLETVSQGVESAFLAGSIHSRLSPAERALFADEFHEMFEEMKARLDAFFSS